MRIDPGDRGRRIVTLCRCVFRRLDDRERRRDTEPRVQLSRSLRPVLYFLPLFVFPRAFSDFPLARPVLHLHPLPLPLSPFSSICHLSCLSVALLRTLRCVRVYFSLSLSLSSSLFLSSACLPSSGPDGPRPCVLAAAGWPLVVG